MFEMEQEGPLKNLLITKPEKIQNNECALTERIQKMAIKTEQLSSPDQKVDTGTDLFVPLFRYFFDLYYARKRINFFIDFVYFSLRNVKISIIYFFRNSK
jgi:hypothetical protein